MRQQPHPQRRLVALGQACLKILYNRFHIQACVQADALDKRSLAPVNAYNPGLSGAWMLQRAMSVRPGEKPNPDFINQVGLKRLWPAVIERCA